MKKLPLDLFEKYKENPLKYSDEVRNFCKLREDRYFSVSIWPEERAGEVRENKCVRTVKDKKISKSDQK